MNCARPHNSVSTGYIRPGSKYYTGGGHSSSPMRLMCRGMPRSGLFLFVPLMTLVVFHLAVAGDGSASGSGSGENLPVPPGAVSSLVYRASAFRKEVESGTVWSLRASCTATSLVKPKPRTRGDGLAWPDYAATQRCA